MKHLKAMTSPFAASLTFLNKLSAGAVKIAAMTALILFTSTLYADSLWDSAVSIYGKNRDSKPNPKSAYILMESGAPGKKSNSNEVWEEYKYEGGKPYRRIIKVMKNGAEQPIPEQAKGRWSPLTNKKSEKKEDYKSIADIFYSPQQKNVTYQRTGKSKTVYGKKCVEYSFTFIKHRKGKKVTTLGKAYLEEGTGAPLEIRRVNTSAYMKGTPDSFVMFTYDGKILYPMHALLIMNIDFLGQKMNMKSECKMEY